MSSPLPLLSNYTCLFLCVSTRKSGDLLPWEGLQEGGTFCPSYRGWRKKSAHSLVEERLHFPGSLKLCETYVWELWAIFLDVFWLCPGFGALTFSHNSQRMCLQTDFSKCLIHCWTSVVWKGQLIPSWVHLSSSAATEFLFQIMWLWKAVYHAVEKDL